MAAAVSWVSFSAVLHPISAGDRRGFASVTRSSLSSSSCYSTNFETSRPRLVGVGKPSQTTAPRLVVHCMSSSSSPDLPTVADTKSNFLKAYKRPIPSIYNNILQELIVLQHLTRYKRTYRYDPVFGLGFVTVYDQLMEGYPGDEDREAIFQAYIKALNEEPEQYRIDAKKLEEWAKAKNVSTLIDFQSKEGEVEGILKDIAERAGSGKFSYSRFFAVGLFRILELSNATEPTILEKLCAALNVDKRSVDRDLDVYRNLLSKLVQAKELVKEYVAREKKKQEERAGSQKASETVTKCLGQPDFLEQ